MPYAEEHGIQTELAYKLAANFGAGMGRLQESCGAVTGAFMAIGLRYGSTDPNDLQAKQLVLEKSRAFVSAFRKKFGSLLCRELLDCDLNTDAGQKKFKDEDQRQKICMACVTGAGEILDSL